MQGLKPAQVKVYDYYETGECGVGAAPGSGTRGGARERRDLHLPLPRPGPSPAALPELSEHRGTRSAGATTLPSCSCPGGTHGTPRGRSGRR